MRKLIWQTSMALLLTASAAHATIIASGGGPGLGVRGQLQAYAEDPLVIDHSASYDEGTADPNGNGSLPSSGSDSLAQSEAEFDGESTVVGSSASSSYTYQFGHLGGELSAGSITLSSYSSVSINDSYFVDPDPNDDVEVFAHSESIATAINFMDLAVSDSDYRLVVSGNVQNDLAQNGGGGSAFVFIADITSGFDFLASFGDDTPNDFNSTPFAGSVTLAVGHTYRFGMGASTDFQCADTTGGTLCPAADPDNGVPAPLPPGFYGESASVLFEFELTPVPEPGTALLLGAGFALLSGRRRN
jgi:hypothetical protein